MSQDYYKTLGVSRTATQDEVKKAYRKLAHQYHPDKKGGSADKFKEINEAYQVISDPQKRSQYDQFGDASQYEQRQQYAGGQGAGGFDFGGGFQGNINFEDIFDIFGNAFGGGRQSNSANRRGEDIHLQMSIPFKEAIQGAKKSFMLDRFIACSDCDGSGMAKGSSMIDCSDCGGSGSLRQSSQSMFGNFSRVVVCPKCNGAGKVPKEKCPKCNGAGRDKARKDIEVSIPAGINNGETLVIRGFGNKGLAGLQSGDLYITVLVQPHKQFTRHNKDIIIEIPVKAIDAILGAKIKVPTLDGEAVIDIPSGTQNGEELHIRRGGVRAFSPGDQIIKVKIEIPKKLSKKARRLFEEVAVEL